MKTFLYSLVFSLIIVLGLFGFLSTFLNNPAALLLQIVIIAAVVALGAFFYRRLAGWSEANEQALYRKAARQSRKRKRIDTAGRKHSLHPAKLRVINNRSRSFHLSREPAKSQGHLTVINGNKNKKKKRAPF
ncbi:MAG: hypothetical protein LKI94_09805 [Sporolactobacillus sp.]|nr:hypothetical protein [Sporolactobacillus sp.]MCI1882475.1 hypothetical protein [Sporolactobacillus sp.]